MSSIMIDQLHKSQEMSDLVKSGLTDRVVNDTKPVFVGLQLTEH